MKNSKRLNFLAFFTTIALAISILPAQAFALSATLAYPEEGKYIIVPESYPNDYAIDVSGGGDAPEKTTLHIWERNNSDAQIFVPKKVGDAYLIVHARTGYVLNLRDGNPNLDGRIWLYHFDHTNSCLFKFFEVQGKPGSYIIQCQNGKKVLDLHNNKPYCGALLHTWSAHEGPSCRWKLVPVMSKRVEYVNSMSKEIFSSAEACRAELGKSFLTATDCLCASQLLRDLGLSVGSGVTTGFSDTAPLLVKDADRLCAVLQLDVASIATQMALAEADSILSYRGKQLDDDSAIRLLEAHQKRAAYASLARAVTGSILDEYAQAAALSKYEQAAFFAEIFLNGTVDGMLGGIKPGEREKTAKMLLAIYNTTSNCESILQRALPLLPAHSEYQHAWQSMEGVIRFAKSL